MRAKSMVLLLIALGCGLVASIGISQVMERGSTGPLMPETREIFVATHDINISDKLDAANVKLEKWPIDKVPEGAITDFAAIDGHYAGSRLFQGEPILTQRLLDKDNSYATTIPDGFRVTAIKVTMDTAVSNLIRPGDRVDVVGFFRKSQDVPETNTRVILRSVRVFSVNSDTTRERDKDGQIVNLTTVSLLIKEDQVETLMLADELGQLRLSPRRPDDTAEDDTEEQATTSKLFTGTSEVAEDPAETVEPTPPPAPVPVATPVPTPLPAPEPKSASTGLLDLLKAAQAAAPAQTGPTAPAFRMVVHTPDGVEVFDWTKRDQLPEGTASGRGIPAIPLPYAGVEGQGSAPDFIGPNDN
ncbi:MAG: Flp pilus assembly protein CpaB [Planctomycetales bacterium]|nr:Flp pilus assembly protein CpaB [Planctomycetales bacterium]